MEKLKQRIDRTTEVSLIFLMGLLVVDVLWQVASRYVLKDPSSFTDELARYLLIWLTLIGSAYATGKKLHLAIDLLPQKLKGFNAIILDKFIYLLILAFAVAVMIIGGARLVYISFALGQLAATLQISLAYVYISLPVSGALIAYYCIYHITKTRAAL